MVGVNLQQYEQQQRTDLKKIIILGRDQSKVFNHVIAEIFRKNLHNDPSYLILGNGESDVDIGKLSVIKDRVNFNTIVHVYAHGSLDSKGLHTLDLTKSGTTYTNELITKLAYYISGCPIFTHLHSCYSGAAVDFVHLLPVGSVIIAHGPADDVSFSNSYEVSLVHDFKRFPELVEANLMKEFLQSINVGIKLKDSTNKLFSVKLTPEIVFGAGLVDHVQNQWNEFYNDLIELENSKLLLANIKLDKKEVDLSFENKELKGFQEHYFKLQCMSNSKEIKDFLKTSSEKVKYLLDRTLFDEEVLESPEMTKALLEAGANANAKNKHDVPLINVAANNKYTESALILIEHGASINNYATLELLIKPSYHKRELVKKLISLSIEQFNESNLEKLLQGISSIQKELDDKYSNYYRYHSFFNPKYAKYFVSECDMEYYQEIFSKLYDANNEVSLNVFLDHYFHICDKMYCSSDLRDTIQNKILGSNNQNLMEKYVGHLADTDSYKLSKVLKICSENHKDWLLYGLKEVDGKTPYMKPILKALVDAKLFTKNIAEEYFKKGAIEVFNTFSLYDLYKMSIDVVKLLFQNGLDLSYMHIPRECPNDPSLTVLLCEPESVNIEFVELLLQNCLSTEEPIMCDRWKVFDKEDYNTDKGAEIKALVDNYASNPPAYCEGNFV